MKYIKITITYLRTGFILLALGNAKIFPSELNDGFKALSITTYDEKEINGVIAKLHETSIKINNKYLLHFTGDSAYVNFTASKYILECRELGLDSLLRIADSAKSSTNDKKYYELESAINKHACNTLYRNYCGNTFPLVKGKRKLRYGGKLFSITKIDSLNRIDVPKHRYEATIDLKIALESCIEYENEVHEK